MCDTKLLPRLNIQSRCIVVINFFFSNSRYETDLMKCSIPSLRTPYTVCPEKLRTTQTSFYNMLFQMTLQKALLGVEIILSDLFSVVIMF